MTGTDVLIYVEDPGAANCVADLPSALQRRGFSATLLAAGHAASHLAALGCRGEAVSANASADDVIDENAPGLLVTGTAEDRDTLGLQLIAAARRRGTPSLGVVDGPAYPGERFRGRGADPLGFAPDRIAVPDEATRRAYMALGLAAGRVVAAGHPLFDRLRSERARFDAEGGDEVRRRVLPEARAGQPVLLFLAEISDGLHPELYRRHAGYRLEGRGGSDARTDIVIEEFLDASRTLGAYRVLRLHPKNTREEFAAYAGEFDLVSAGGAPHELACAADVVVGMTTVLLAEAVLLGRPTLSIVPDPAEAAWLSTAASGLTPVVSRREQIAPALRAGLRAQPDVTAIDRALPPGAQDRLADLIVTMLKDAAAKPRRMKKESA